MTKPHQTHDHLEVNDGAGDSLTPQHINQAWSELRSACAAGDTKRCTKIIADCVPFAEGELAIHMLTYACDVLGQAPVGAWGTMPFSKVSKSPWALMVSLDRFDEPTTLLALTDMTINTKTLGTARLHAGQVFDALIAWRFLVANLMCDWLGGERKEAWREALHTFLLRQIPLISIITYPSRSIRDQHPELFAVCEQLMQEHGTMPQMILDVLCTAPAMLHYDLRATLKAWGCIDQGDPQSELGRLAHDKRRGYRTPHNLIAAALCDRLDACMLEVIMSHMVWRHGLEPRER